VCDTAQKNPEHFGALDLDLGLIASHVHHKSEPNVAVISYACMAEFSPDQKRTDLLFGNTVVGVLLFAAISGALIWLAMILR